MNPGPLLDVTIPGLPVGKERARVTKHGTYTPAKTRDWEDGAVWLIRAEWQNRPAPWAPLAVLVSAVGQRPKRMLRKKDPEGRMWRMAKPDGDNVLKAACDALVKAGVIRDDCCLVLKTVGSYYAAKGEEPHVRIVLSEITELRWI